MFLLCGLFPVQAQVANGKSAFDKLLDSISVKIASYDTKKALFMADSLIKNADNKNQKIKALMLNADILTRKDRYYESLSCLFYTLELLEPKDVVERSWIYGYLGHQYRELGFFDVGESFLQESVKLHELIPDPRTRQWMKGKALDEYAQFAMVRGQYDRAEEYLVNAISYFSTLENFHRHNFFMARAYQLRGDIKIYQNKPKEALEIYQMALDLVQEVQGEETLHAGFIYQGLGESYLLLNDLDKALEYSLLALEIAEKGDFTQLKLDTYQSLKSYYRTTRDLEEYKFYTAKMDSLLVETQKNRQAMVNGVSQYLRTDELFMEGRGGKPDSAKAKMFLWIIPLTVIILLVGLFFLRRKKGAVVFKRRQRGGENEKISEEGGKTFEELPLVTRNELREKLKIFEERKGYLDPHMSYPNLVTELETNSKYLKYALNYFADKDFRTYLNDLRIAYIVEQLETNKKFRNYKLSWLANESGFASYSAFASNFKRVKGLSPSKFIKNLAKESKPSIKSSL